VRRGSLSERTIRCGKAACACADNPKARHGPDHSLTQAVGGKTRSRFLTDDQAALALQQIAAGRQFRQHVDAYWEACEQWADAQLEPKPAAPAGEVIGANAHPEHLFNHWQEISLRTNRAQGQRTGGSCQTAGRLEHECVFDNADRDTALIELYGQHVQIVIKRLADKHLDASRVKEATKLRRQSSSPFEPGPEAEEKDSV
jgi:hypothetical protein